MRINELEQLYEVFVRISGYITYEGKDGSLENFTNAVIEYIDDKETKIEALRAIINEFENSVKDKDEEIKDLQEKLKDYEETINYLENENSLLRDNINGDPGLIL